MLNKVTESRITKAHSFLRMARGSKDLTKREWLAISGAEELLEVLLGLPTAHDDAETVLRGVLGDFENHAAVEKQSCPN